MRTTVAVLGAAGALTAAQLGLAGAASASTVSSQATANCPIKITYLTKFYVDQNNWVTNGGLKFGLKNSSKKQTFKDVSLKVQNTKNLRFGKATVTTKPIGRITQKTNQTVKIAAKTLKPGKSAAFKVSTHMLRTDKYEVKFTVYGKTASGKKWGCAVDQGTWGTVH
ncbi:hypothetical protein PV416_13265 [Streptomyces ipomoeae]|jgi:hypothetical protein|nr:hypothetical protein [Streptomyces ipomoeae]MDX2700489.1 hypothetical protein [Streptomyces ipomoeae]MDX2822043.1 hypothetical protein [Streptomyces ipomoeae]MDX2846645.1 hypothetical protein [Streptomyces ipomoeae]MDX2880569.1 hypothetical protein [Streptomyces ipomoeae]MDX2938663.1 hypothetical protein [Streptomyces ipomoeae]